MRGRAAPTRLREALHFSAPSARCALGNGGRPPPFFLPEHEYQVRLGATINVLRDTLPLFMERALVDDIHAKQLQLLNVGQHLPHDIGSHVYHPEIHFQFSPTLLPLARLPDWDVGAGWPLLPPAVHRGDEDAHSRTLAPESRLPGPLLSLYGRRKYLMSARVLQTTLRALLYNTSITLESLVFVPARSGAASAGRVAAATGDSHRSSGADADANSSGPSADELVARLRFCGLSRVSDSLHDYTVVFRYRFDRASGSICKHTVDNMAPLPGRRVWAGLAAMRAA